MAVELRRRGEEEEEEEAEARRPILEEGEYETQFGRVVVEKTEDGYKIVIYISKEKLADQIAARLLALTHARAA